MIEPTYAVTIAPYTRPFRQPLYTSHGPWKIREGAIVTLQSANGSVGQGEIAPLTWFGSESLTTALQFYRSLQGHITTPQIFAIPDHLPCCQFAFETALTALQANLSPGKPTDTDKTVNAAVPPNQIAALLPTGKAAINAWPTLYAKGHRTFKWKIGVSTITEERVWFQQLCQHLPQNCRLRLDANAGLSLVESEQWLECCEAYPVEYLEQPLSVSQFSEMQMLSAEYSTPIALDESIANLHQLETSQNLGWPGIYVIKPAIVGSPRRLTELIRQQSITAIFASVFETEVGYAAALDLAQSLQKDNRAFGFGTKDWW